MANPGPRRPADDLFPNRRVAIIADLCVVCSLDAVDFKDDVSRREYGISGMCQRCQDEFFAEPEIDEIGRDYYDDGTHGS